MTRSRTSTFSGCEGRREGAHDDTPTYGMLDPSEFVATAAHHEPSELVDTSVVAIVKRDPPADDGCALKMRTAH